MNENIITPLFLWNSRKAGKQENVGELVTVAWNIIYLVLVEWNYRYWYRYRLIDQAMGSILRFLIVVFFVQLLEYFWWKMYRNHIEKCSLSVYLVWFQFCGKERSLAKVVMWLKWLSCCCCCCFCLVLVFLLEIHFYLIIWFDFLKLELLGSVLFVVAWTGHRASLLHYYYMHVYFSQFVSSFVLFCHIF